MTQTTRIGIVVALLVVVGGTMALKQREKDTAPAAAHPQVEASAESQPGGTAGVLSPVVKQAVPRLVELGASKCIPCRMMAPILEELKTEYAGRMDVEFIDVWENRDAGEKYGISSIPTQIFYDASGKELYRHPGFFSKEDILGKWKELGVDLAAKPVAADRS